MDAERKAFEKWYDTEVMPPNHSHWFRFADHGDYQLEQIAEAWKAWSAAIRWSRLSRSSKAGVAMPEKMTDYETLEYCGADAAKWAEQFRLTAIRLGYSDMDEGWLIGWFANAIETAAQVRREKALAD